MTAASIFSTEDRMFKSDITALQKAQASVGKTEKCSEELSTPLREASKRYSAFFALRAKDLSFLDNDLVDLALTFHQTSFILLVVEVGECPEGEDGEYGPSGRDLRPNKLGDATHQILYHPFLVALPSTVDVIQGA